MTIIGVTATRGDCKRGIAANLAAYVAASGPEEREVAIVDLDAESDVGQRFAVAAPGVGRLCELSEGVSTRALSTIVARAAWPPMIVVPYSAQEASASRSALGSVLARLEGDGRTVVLDVPPIRHFDELPVALGGVQLDHLVLSVSATRADVAAADRLFSATAECPVTVAITGDEGSSALGVEDCGDALGRAVVEVRQWWGRSRPNRGFGPSLGFPPIEEELARLAGHCGALSRPVSTCSA